MCVLHLSIAASIRLKCVAPLLLLVVLGLVVLRPSLPKSMAAFISSSLLFNNRQSFSALFLLLCL